jgi:hypothetical protein
MQSVKIRYEAEAAGRIAPGRGIALHEAWAGPWLLWLNRPCNHRCREAAPPPQTALRSGAGFNRTKWSHGREGV